MANPVISKIKLANGTVVDLKDAAARSDLATLLGTNTLAALGDAAWLGVDTSLADNGAGVATSGVIKSYVDAQVGAINKFDVVMAQAKGGSGSDKNDPATTASASTMYQLTLVQDANAEAGTYIEYITVRSGSKDNYTYAWEKIGSTKADLSDYLKTADAEAWTVGGVSFGSEHAIPVASLSSALDLKAFAHASSASGTVSYDKVSAITMNAVEVSGNAAVTTTSASATLSKSAFTPAGTVSGNVTATGTVSVVLKDAASATSASVSYSAYTPEGTIAAASTDGSFSALKTAAFTAATSDTGVQITGSVAAPSVTLNFTGIDVISAVSAAAVLPSFSEGAFTAATWTSSSYTAPTWTGASYTAPTMGTATTGSFANEGIVATVNTSASAGASDYELLVFTAASTGSAVTAQGTFSAGSLDFGSFSAGSLSFGTFNGGSKVADTWDAGSAATFSTAKVVPSSVTASASAPVFTGGYFKVATTEDTALKSVVFTGTEKANALVTGVTYVKPEVSSATFTGSSASISATFAGTEVSDALVTGVTYDKADASAAFSVSVTPSVSDITYSSATTSVTVS